MARRIVNFPEFRRHTAARKDADTSIMGLLVGSQMAAHFLSLTDGSAQLLPAIFPGVQHVTRFNLTSSTAREVLLNADRHLGMMAVPYALGIHEDLLRKCLELAGHPSPEGVRAWALHKRLEGHCAPARFDADSLAQLDTLREMRNATIHSGGIIDQRVVDQAAAMSPAAETHWKKLVGRSPVRLTVGDRVDFGTGEMFLALSATKALARQANEMLTRTLSATRWAEVLVDDFTAHHPAHRRNRWNVRKKLLGWARYHYREAEIPETKIVAVAKRKGLL